MTIKYIVEKYFDLGKYLKYILKYIQTYFVLKKFSEINPPVLALKYCQQKYSRS